MAAATETTGSGARDSLLDERLADYAALFQGMTKQRLQDLRRLCRGDIHFRDPFNDLRGIDGYIRALEKMYTEVRDPAFAVHDSVRSGRHGYLRWTFTARSKKGSATWRFEGMSEIVFDDDGLIGEHLDHWDAASQLYEKLPLIGMVLRAIRRKLAA